MPQNSNLIDLDVDKLFEEHKIDEIVELEKLLDAEIERKRVDLRSMVGDRYKDILAASDAIKNMKTISQGIVDNIQKITEICERVVNEDPAKEINLVFDPKIIEERELIIQIRLAICLNEEIWVALDSGDNLEAAQLYLLAQHIHMGLKLTKKDLLNRLPLLEQIQSSFQTLREQIFNRIKLKLQSVEVNAEETGSNLNALLLLQNHSTNELLNIFVEHRKTALKTVIESPHNSVRLQISAMVRCLITTVHLLYDCFMASHEDNKKGLIWQQLQHIVENTSQTTLQKIKLPTTPLVAYIPDIIKEFRPKYQNTVEDPLNKKISLDDWLVSTKTSVKNALENSLKLVTNVKGLHLIREEALKIELPRDWEKICAESNLPQNFNIWYYFFQDLLRIRAKDLISQKITLIVRELEADISSAVKSENIESDLKLNIWSEEPEDVSRKEHKHSGLAMKTLGYSKNIVLLCEKLNAKYLSLLADVSQYLYGTEYNENNDGYLINISDAKRFIDREELQKHMQTESIDKSKALTVFCTKLLEQGLNNRVWKSLFFARFLQAVANLCEHFKRCCTFHGVDGWNELCTHFGKTSLNFWMNWVGNCVANTNFEAQHSLSRISACGMVAILPRWDCIEIQEQTDENIFKSQIKVPLKPSLLLSDLLTKLNNDLDQVVPHTLPKQIHVEFIGRNVEILLKHYEALSNKELNQNQSLQFLFDVKFLTTLCIPRENANLLESSQQICDTLRAKIDPFDLDVFYSYLQANVKRAVVQSQTFYGCLLPSTNQLANVGVSEKITEQDKEPSILAINSPSITSWFPLLPISVPTQKNLQSTMMVSQSKPSKSTPKSSQDIMKSSAASLFGSLATDWFS